MFRHAARVSEKEQHHRRYLLASVQMPWGGAAKTKSMRGPATFPASTTDVYVFDYTANSS